MSDWLTVICANGVTIRDLEARVGPPWVVGSDDERSFWCREGGDADAPAMSVQVGWDDDDHLKETLEEISSDAPGYPAAAADLRVFYAILTRQPPTQLLTRLLDHDETWIDQAGIVVPGRDFARTLARHPDWNWGQVPLPEVERPRQS